MECGERFGLLRHGERSDLAGPSLGAFEARMTAGLKKPVRRDDYAPLGRLHNAAARDAMRPCKLLDEDGSRPACLFTLSSRVRMNRGDYWYARFCNSARDGRT